MPKLKYYVKERHNPQFDFPYFTYQGRLTKVAASKMEETLYGINIMHAFGTEEEARGFVARKTLERNEARARKKAQSNRN